MSTQAAAHLIEQPASIALLLAAMLSSAAPAMVQAGGPASGQAAPAAPTRRQGPIDPAELRAFLDDRFARDMAANHIAGAAVAVVEDGKLLLARGYGQADIANGVPVDPERTVFRVGSVGKLFTWTAVMQLVEQGKLDLGADINTYLDFRVPDTYSRPITLAHLMTHTSGFEDVLLGSVVSDAGDLMPEREWLTAHMAARVRPPGDAAGYSNYNAMLAGYIVARAAGQPYDQYVQDRIFDPLGMAHSTAGSRMPPDLRASASEGYTYVDGAFQPFPDYLPQPALLPSGGHRASAADMARFMIAHLEGGRYGQGPGAGGRILKGTTARRMQATLYTPDPRLRGTAYGFFDLSDNGQRALGHEGYAPPMHSQVLLLPDRHVGVFVVYNSMGAGMLTKQHVGFQRAFFDHFYPAPAAALTPVEPPAGFAERAGRFVGSYSGPGGGHTTLVKLAGLFNATRISNPGDGTLRFAIEGLEFRFVEVGPRYFRQVDGPFHLLFREDDRGRITHLFTDLMPQYAAVRLRRHQTPEFNLTLLQACGLLFASVILAAPVRAVRDRRRPAPAGGRGAHAILAAISVLNLSLVAGTMQWIMQPSELHSPSTIVRIVLGLGVVSAALTVAAVAWAALAWKQGRWSMATRLHYTLATAAAVAFVWFLNHWNLLGWRF